MATTLYTKSGCPYCASLRGELDAAGKTYTEINVSECPEVIPELVKITGGVRKVPVLVDGTEISVAPSGG